MTGNRQKITRFINEKDAHEEIGGKKHGLIVMSKWRDVW